MTQVEHLGHVVMFPHITEPAGGTARDNHLYHQILQHKHTPSQLKYLYSIQFSSVLPRKIVNTQLNRQVQTMIIQFTVPGRKFVAKVRVRYHDQRWRRQQPVRMFTPRYLLFRIVFHVLDAGYRAIVSYCFYVIPESVIEFDKTAVHWCTKYTEDLGNSSVRSW